MIKMAHDEVGFTIDNSNIAMQITPLKDNGLIVTFTDDDMGDLAQVLAGIRDALESGEGDAEDMQGYGRMSHILLRRCRMVVVCGKEVTGTMNTEISMADRLHIICTTLDGLVQIKESK